MWILRLPCPSTICQIALGQVRSRHDSWPSRNPSVSPLCDLAGAPRNVRCVCEGVAQRRGPNSVIVPSGASPLPRDYESTLGCTGAFMMRSISGPPVFIKRQMSSAAKTRKATLSKVV